MGKNTNVFTKKGNWYKGNIHTHTDVFDGLEPAETVINLYKSAGYNFLSITDHNIFKSYNDYNCANFLMLNGLELTCGIQIDNPNFKEELLKNASGSKISQDEMTDSLIASFNTPDLDPRRLPHVVAIARDENTKWDNVSSKGFDNIQYMLDLAKEHNFLSIIAHPVWSKLNSKDLHGLKDYTAIEVYNHTCDAYFAGGNSSVHWDDMLHEGMPTNAIACDDMHNTDFSLGAYIMVKAEKLDYKSIIEAIEKGEYYSSMKPEIHNVTIVDDTVYVECSKAYSVRFISDIVMGRLYIDKNSNMTKCSHKLMGRETYVRVEITDKDKYQAWSNPIYINRGNDE
ncbi:MAG: hypothetical protein ACK5LV_08790 [Lachnospirales bacterium]